MLTVRDLADRFGLHEKRVRERLAALSPLIDPHVVEGKQNAKLLTDAGVAIFDRLTQLERDGLTIQTSVQKLGNELSGQRETSVQRASSEEVTSRGDFRDEVISLLKEQLDDVKNERDRLMAIVENQGEQIRALMPARVEKAESSREEQRFSRWHAFRLLLFGKT